MKRIRIVPTKNGKGSIYLAVLVTVLLTAMVQLLQLTPVHRASALATTPTTMNFQGRLTNSSGNIMADGLYNMKFRLYDAASAGTLKWSEIRETTNRVQVTNGLFSVQLGQVTPLDPTIFASGSLYFEIELPTPATATCTTASCGTFTEGPMTPRNKLSTSAYAYNAETLDGIDSAQFARNDTANTFTGAQVIRTTSTGAFQVQNTGGTTTYLNVDTSGDKVSTTNLEIGAGKFLSLLGGTTATRPGTPSEGMVYYDTTTKQLLTYANGKWQSDSKTVTIIVAAGNSAQADKDGAQFIGNGTADDVAINAAIAALPTSGGNIFLMPGTYNITAPVVMSKTDSVLQGAGRSTQLKRSYNSATAASFISITGNRSTIRDLLIDGNKATYTSVNNIGIGFDANNAHLILNNWIINNQSYAIDSGINGSDSIINGNDISGGGTTALRLYAQNVLVTNNRIYSNSGVGVQSGDSGRPVTVTGNNIYSNTSGVKVVGTVSGNRIYNNTNEGVALVANANVTGNQINGNGIGVSATCADAAKFTVTGNSIMTSTTYGVYIDCGGGAFGGTVSGNTIADSGNEGIRINNTVTGITISGNTIQNNGGTGAFNSINFANGASTNNFITGNFITDTAGTGYAINMNGTSGNYLSDNIFNGTGATAISDTGSNTYSSQMNGSGQLLSAASAIKSTATNAFQIQNAGATETLLTANTSSNQVKIGNSTASVAADVSLLVVDNAPSTITPTGVAGAMYYDSTNNKFKCYTTAWVDCDTAANGVTTIGAFTGASIANGASISANTLTLGAADGTNPGIVTVGAQTIAGNKTFTGTTTTNDIEVAAGRFIHLAGGITGTRPGTPTEGMVYFDSTTKELLSYANGKWQADRTSSTKIVAASNSSQAARDGADYVATGTGDQTIINNALTAAAGGTVYLLEGTYSISGTILVPNNTSLSGAGDGTLITIPNTQNGAYQFIKNSDVTTGTGVAISSLRIDGNKANNATATNTGIRFDNMGAGSGSTARKGGSISNVTVVNIAGNYGIHIFTSANNSVHDNTIQSTASHGIFLDTTSNFNTISNNTILGSATNGVYIASSDYNTINDNNINASPGAANIAMNVGKYNTISGNTLAFAAKGIDLTSGQNTLVNGNNITDPGQTNFTNGIYLTSTTYSTITGNTVTDTSCATSCYAIVLNGVANTGNYLGNNYLDGNDIADNSTTTVYANQFMGTVAAGVAQSAATRVKATSTTAFQVQNASAAASFTVDTSGNKVQVGSATTDTTAVQFILDSYSTAADPAGTNGAMYYNTALAQYRCFRDGDWEPCGTKPIDRGYILEEEFISGATAATGAGYGNLNWISTTLAGGACNTFAYNGGSGGAAVSADRPGILKFTTLATNTAGCRLGLGVSGANTMMLAAGQVIKASGGLANGAANTATIRIGADSATTSQAQVSGAGTSGVWWEADPTVNANWRYCYVNSAGTAVCAASTVVVATNVLPRVEIKINAVGTNTSNIDFSINGITSNVSGVTLNNANAVRPDIVCYAQVAVAQGCFMDYYMIRGDASAAR